LNKGIFVVLIIIIFISQVYAQESRRQVFELETGWNLFSLNVSPENNEFANIFAEQISSGELVQIKNTIFTNVPELPSYLNTFDAVSAGSGYAVRLDAAQTLEISGEMLDIDITSINLISGWNLVGYVPQNSMEVAEAFAALISSGILLKVQSETESFDPNLPAVFNTLDLVEPGFAYWVEVNEDVIFNYPSESFREGRLRTREIFPRPWEYSLLPSSTVTYCNVTINGEQAEAGDEVGAFIDGECRGYGDVFIMGGNATMFFNIQCTGVETIHFNVWDASEGEVLDVTYTTQTNPGGDIGYPPNQLPIDAFRPEPESWDPIVYKHSTTIFGRVAINGMLAEDGDIVGAFIGGECRGRQEVILENGTAYVSLLVNGEIEEMIDFKVWDVSEDEIYELDFGIMSDPNDILGYPPDFLPLYYGDLPFGLELPENVSFFVDDLMVIDYSAYIDYLFLEDIELIISGNVNLNVEINGLEATFGIIDGWTGSEQISVTIQNMISGESIIDEMMMIVMPGGEAIINGIYDVPDDEGGFVNINFQSSYYDNGTLAEIYHILYQFEDIWQVAAEIIATGAGEYNVIVETFADSTAEDAAMIDFKIVSEMEEGIWESEVFSGYSVDNLAPEIPAGVEISGGNLFWDAAYAADLAGYIIYLNNQQWLATQDTIMSMIGIAGEVEIEAIDIHGNYSGRSALIYGGYLYGDIDHNYIVEAFDASLALQYFCLLPPEGIELPWSEWRQQIADVDGNGNIEAYDAALILRFNLGMITEFPIE